MKDGSQVLFRTEGGTKIGFGHVRRCLSLASSLKSYGLQCSFLLNGDGRLIEYVFGTGFPVLAVDPCEDLEQTLNYVRQLHSQAIVLDSYNLDFDYVQTLSQAVELTIVIDDLGRSGVPADIVINGAAGAERLSYVRARKTEFYLGPAYALLRQEFASEPAREISAAITKVLITMGGSDPQGLTSRLIQWVAEILPAACIHAVIGPLYEDADELYAGSSSWRNEVKLHFDPQDLRTLMLSSDLAICSGGQTTYELAATGTPAIAVRTGDNQSPQLKALAERETLIWAGDARDRNLKDSIFQSVDLLAHNPARRARLSKQGRAVVDGRGASRVAKILEQRLHKRNHANHE